MSFLAHHCTSYICKEIKEDFIKEKAKIRKIVKDKR